MPPLVFLPFISYRFQSVSQSVGYLISQTHCTPHDQGDTESKMLHPLHGISSSSSHKTDGLAVPVPMSTPARQWAMGAEAFENVMPHHAGIKALWETKWKLPCSRSVYPFHDGALEDFEPIFADLIARGAGDGGTSPEYTRAFFATAEALERRGDELLGDKATSAVAAAVDAKRKEREKQASALYLRAACVLRIARFPYVASFPLVTDPIKLDAWERQKRVSTLR